MKFEYPTGATPIDENETDGLIPTHISHQNDLNEWEQMNINEAIKFYSYKNYKVDEILEFGFILSVHEKMFYQTWKWAGKIRESDKNIGIPSEQIREELKKLLDDVKFQINNKSYFNDEICARFHHRLVKIHLFPNGNG